MQVGSDIELYESDNPRIIAVASKLKEHVGKRLSKDAFVREVMERFHEAGYLVDVKVTTMVAEGGTVYHPEITVCGRVEREDEYDFERQAAEVRASDLGERGGVGMPGAGKLWTPES
jgi:hypothetical protein